MFGLESSLAFLLIFCLLAAVAFEFINGFHDTANAVATVIYTNSLKPQTAVIWSGMWNFIGVNVGGIAVAMGIVNLLPTEALIDQNIYHSISMIMALILTAIIWNLGTWYFGIPCSSSHTLIGSIFGVGIAYMLLPGNQTIALNWAKVSEVGLSLLISPIFGFGLALLFMYLLRLFIRNRTLFKEAEPGTKPPMWVRAILVLTCTSVSFSHGSNDGQKGVGLIMIILIGIVPARFAIDQTQKPERLLLSTQNIEQLVHKIDSTELLKNDIKTLKLVNVKIDTLKKLVNNLTKFDNSAAKTNFELRRDIILIAKKTEGILKNYDKKPLKSITSAEITSLKKEIKTIKTFTEYSPWWVILMVSLSLGFGTMVGWKRIVVTIGEKIGKSHLTYAQGASAELIAASTIAVSTWFGLPVSTTHVLSSGVAGSMVAENGFKNLQSKTIKNIGIAWLITLPVTILLSGILFLTFRLIFA